MTNLSSVADTVRTTVTDAESKVTGAVRDLQAPVVEYVHKGIAFAEERLPDYPSNLPTPGEVIDSQREFVAAQVDRVKAVAAKVAPHVGITVAEPRRSTSSTKSSTKSSSTSGAKTGAKARKSTKATKKSA